MVSDIPAGDGNIEKLFYGVYSVLLSDTKEDDPALKEQNFSPKGLYIVEAVCMYPPGLLPRPRN